MSKIIVNGCSHTHGWGLPKDGRPWPRLLFPSCINLANSGDSNIAIARRTLEYIVCNKDVSHVFVMWTDNSRTEFSTDDGRLIHVLANSSFGSRFPLQDLTSPLNSFVRDYYKYFFSPLYHLKLFLLNLHHLKVFCESQGIRFCCAASMPIDYLDKAETFDKQYKKLLKKYNSMHLGGIHEQSNLTNADSFVSLIEQTKSCWIDQSYLQGHVMALDRQHWTSLQDQHANQQGHHIIADQLRKLLPKGWPVIK